MEQWNNVYITDKTGKKFFNTSASPMSTYSEIKNLKRHMKHMKEDPDHYRAFLDIASAVLMLNGEPYGDDNKELSISDLLGQLGSDAELGVYLGA